MKTVQLPFTDPKRRFATRKLLFGSEDGTFLAREEAFMGTEAAAQPRVKLPTGWVDTRSPRTC